MGCELIFHFVNPIICIFGLIGNTLSVIVLVQPVMRNPFNILLLGLSFCDSLLLGLIFAYSTLLDLVPYPLLSFAQISSIYFTIAISLERFVAVSCPLHAQRILTNRNSKFLVTIVMAFSGLLSALSYFLEGICLIYYVTFVDIIVKVLLPFAALLILNVFIHSKVRRAERERALMTDNEKSEASITITLFYIVIVFAICYIPSLCYISTYLFMTIFGESQIYYYIIRLISMCGVYYLGVTLNSSLNFFIYFTSGQKFRTTLKIVLSSGLLKLKVWNRNPNPKVLEQT